MSGDAGNTSGRDDAPRLVLVLSSERSGSTLLRVMLGEHPRVVAPAELFLLRYEDYAGWRGAKPTAIASLAEAFRLAGVPRSPAEIDAECRQLATVDVYRRLLAALPAGALLVDKTPAYANGRDALRRSRALDPYCVWLIRHPLGVIDSFVLRKFGTRRTTGWLHRLRDALGSLAGLPETDMTVRARLRETKWALQQTNILHFVGTLPPTRWCAVHFEDLVADPASAMRPLCDALGITLDAAMLAPTVRGRRMHPDLGDPNFHTRDGLEHDKAWSWRGRLSEDRLRPETRSLMREIGVRSPDRPSGAASPGRARLS